MRIGIYPADKGGCGQYRLRWPAAALEADLTVHETWPKAHRRKQPNGLDYAVRVDVEDDVVVFQRPLWRAVAEVIPLLQRQGVAVVVEIDDDFHALPHGHPARRETSGRHNPDLNRYWLRRSCMLADLVTVSTPALAERYAPHGRFHLLPNCVPEHYLYIEPKGHEGVWVGWTGSTVTHVEDLRVCGTGVRDAVDATRSRLHVVGTGAGVGAQLGVNCLSSTGWVDIEDYPHRYAELDVALVPLQPNRFNEAKSSLKMSEAGALGVPVVGSPTGPNRELHGLGVGELADTPMDWYRHVKELAADESRRADLAARGREVMAGRTIEGNAWRWLEAWERAVHVRDERKVA